MLVPAVFLVLLTVGLPGERGCGGAPQELDRALACDTAVTAAPLTGTPATRIVYLNRVGVTLKAGMDDAAQDVSSVLTRRQLEQLTIPSADFTDPEWRSVVSCVQQRFARFDVDFVTERPAGVDYPMVVFGGTGAELGFGADIGGTAPIDSACKTIDRAVAFVFSHRLGSDPQLHCEVAAQELAHAFSVDHSFVAADAMSYLPSSTPKTFQDLDAPCGEFQPRPCVCGRPSQNSYRLLLERLGPASRRPDLSVPSLQVSLDRSRGDSVVVTAKATDDRAVAQLRLTVRDSTGDVSSTCGDQKFPCTPGADATTFLVAGAQDGTLFQVSAFDAAGNLVTATATLAPSTQPVIELRAQASSAARRMVSAILRSASPITDATLRWTQPDGSVSRIPLCARADGSWSVPIELSTPSGERRMAIEFKDAAGKTNASAEEDLAFGP